MTLCTLYGIVARDGRSAVVLRRGPSRSVLLLRWWLGSDRIEEGQRFRGRVHEDRCDLSPDGEYLLYFAAKPKDPFGTWSAISRPPFFTALALWPKGDRWGGGGLFLGPRQVALDHPSTEQSLAPGFALPKDWRVERMVYSQVSHESAADPNLVIGGGIEYRRMLRDGWTYIPGIRHEQKRGSPVWMIFDPPLIFRRQQPGRSNVILSSITDGLFVRNGPSRQHRAEITDHKGNVLRRFDSADWVDFSHDGDLLLGHTGRLYRLPAKRAGIASDDPLEGATLVADLRPLVFRPLLAPAKARRW
jgi:hypothetical protein